MDFLAATRLSRHRGEADPSTSPERQRELLTATVEDARGDTIVGWAEDLNVSAITLSPFDRPKLGPWLRDRVSEYQGVAWAKLDRAVRNMRDLHTLAEWAVENKKFLLFVSGHGSEPLELDMRGGRLAPIPHLLMLLLAFAAEMEADAISERNRTARAWMRARGRWPGGMFPYHTWPEKTDEGYFLKLNDETKVVVEDCVRRVLKGESKNSIVTWLNDEGVPSPREYRLLRAGKVPIFEADGRITVHEEKYQVFSKKTGKMRPVVDVTVELFPLDGGEPKKYPLFPRHAELAVKTGDVVEKGDRVTLPIMWNAQTLRNLLRARALIGVAELNGKPLLDPDGIPVKRVEPLITDRAVWDKLQQKIDDQAKGAGQVRTKGASQLLGIGFCARCGERLYYRSLEPYGRPHRYYGCRSNWGYIARQHKDERCTALSNDATSIEEVVETLIKGELGDVEVQEDTVIPGTAYASELAELEAEYDDKLARSRVMKPGRTKSKLEEDISRLSERIDKLAELPELPERTVSRGTGETFSEFWDRASEEERRDLLMSKGIRVFVQRDPDDVPALIEAQETLRAAPHRRTAVLDGEGFRTWLLWEGQSLAIV